MFVRSKNPSITRRAARTFINAGSASVIHPPLDQLIAESAAALVVSQYELLSAIRRCLLELVFPAHLADYALYKFPSKIHQRKTNRY